MKLHSYAAGGDCEGLRTELARGVPVDARDELDYTPLACASSSPQAGEEVLRLLIDVGADVNAAVEESKRVPVGLAACAGDAGKVQLLLDAGANVNFKSPQGYTSLIYLMYSLHGDERLVPMARLLVSRGALVDCESDYRESPVSVAGYFGRFDAVQFLLDAGADTAPLQWSKLSAAVALGSCDDVQRLLARGGGIGGCDRWDRTPWLLAALAGDVEKAKLLRAAGANVNDRDRAGQTALMICALRGNAQLLQWLIEIECDLVVHDRSGSFQILGYPPSVFPPTDFHSATYVAGDIYIIGGLGYPQSRRFGFTPVYRLNCRKWSIEPCQSCGENPGWIYSHKTRCAGPGALIVAGGTVCREMNGEENHIENQGTFRLDLASMKWTRIATK